MKNYEEDPDVELNVVHIGASEKKKPYPELKTTDHAICKSITEGKVKKNDFFDIEGVDYVQNNSKAFKFVSIGHNHNHSNMDDSLCLVMIIEIWMTFMLRITVIEIWVIHVTVIAIWVT
ncbi:hypothetical protein QL285_045737 [Trifolium repens]|nr:hypothetical protein QL285_045737 [Trifolium repens]